MSAAAALSKMVMQKCLSLLFVLFFCNYYCYGTPPTRKFEYKLSFKGPHLIQKDGSVPFWDYGGDAIASDDNIRITPSLRSKKGWVWSRNQMVSEHWEIEVIFRVTGRGRIGADGLAIWFTEEKGTEGPVFGSNDKWKGLALFMDSFDNDQQHNNPYVLAMVNDGTLIFDHQTDGVRQQLGGCLRDFRNKPHAVRAKIEYFKKALTIYFHSGMSNNRDDFELCMRAENIDLPKTGYFGITAATGGLADDHDVITFLTHSLVPEDYKVPPDGRVSDDDKKKYEQEFDDYHEKLEKAKEEYQKDHPDRTPDPYDIPDDKWFESQNERELKQIFDGQNNIHLTMRELSRKLDEILGRQELVLSRVSSMSGGQVQVPQGGAPPGGGVPMIDTIKRHEVERVLNNQNDLLSNVRDLKTVLSQVQNKGTQGGGGFQDNLIIHELKDTLAAVRTDTDNLLKRPQYASSNCPPIPPAPSCISPTYFFIGLALQIALMFVYAAYKQSKDAQAKKFY